MGAVLVVFMVRPRGLEPPQDCSYQPLKLARLPFRHDRLSWLFNGISPKKLERVKRIELSQSAWKAEVLPLNYTRLYMVGKTGFEPATPWSQTRCSTKLSHFPNKWRSRRESNPRSPAWQAGMLTATPLDLLLNGDPYGIRTRVCMRERHVC